TATPKPIAGCKRSGWHRRLYLKPVFFRDVPTKHMEPAELGPFKFDFERTVPDPSPTTPDALFNARVDEAKRQWKKLAVTIEVAKRVTKESWFKTKGNDASDRLAIHSRFRSEVAPGDHDVPVYVVDNEIASMGGASTVPGDGETAHPGIVLSN